MPLKWIWTLAAARTPAMSAGRKGRMPDSGGDPHALEDVECQMHSAVPWKAVTIEERAA